MKDDYKVTVKLGRIDVFYSCSKCKGLVTHDGFITAYIPLSGASLILEDGTGYCAKCHKKIAKKANKIFKFNK